MGTRNLTVVIQKEEPKVAQYGQWDGYPEGQGVTILEFLRNNSLAKFRDQLALIRFNNKEDNKEYEDFCKSIGADGEWVNMEQSRMINDRFPLLSRDNGGGILEMIYNLKSKSWISNSIDFGKDTISCEWCYIVNLDDGTFEVYNNYPGEQLAIYGLANLPTKEQFLSDFECEDE